MDANEVTICRTNSDCVFGFARGVAVAFWRFHTNAQDVLELEATASQARKASGQPVALIQVVPASAITPDAEARAALARMLRNLYGSVSHSAIVHEAEGFRAAMIRSIVTGVAALSNPGFPHRVFGRLPEAVAWISQENPRLGARKLTMTVARVRAAIPSAKSIEHLATEEPRRSF